MVKHIPKTLTTEQAKKYYDNFGAKQDSQGFYEDKPIHIMFTEGEFEQAESVFEFGCGTGKKASELFTNILSETCTYTGQDISDTMIELAQKNLEHWKERVTVRKTDGSATLPDVDNSFDRFYSTYVLDLLPPEKTKEVLQEAKRVLRSGGKLCLVGITTGKNIPSKLVSSGWSLIFKIRPATVGGCRPINLLEYIKEPEWNILFHKKVTAKLVASEILIAEPIKEKTN